MGFLKNLLTNIKTTKRVSTVQMVQERGNGFYSYNGKMYQSDIVRACIRPKIKAIGKVSRTVDRALTELMANYGTPEAKIRVIPNSVDFRRFDPDNLDQAFIAEKRREWGIREGDHVVMAIGRITPVKGLEELIRNFSTLTSGEDAASPLKLVIVGGADKHHQKYLDSLKKLAKDLRRETGDVIFAGGQSKIPECIAIADEIVSGNVTKPETFGLSVVEAYAMNKPVRVTRRFGGVAEVMDAVERSGCATLREAVIKLYGTDKFAERTLTVYREVCRA